LNARKIKFAPATPPASANRRAREPVFHTGLPMGTRRLNSVVCADSAGLLIGDVDSRLCRTVENYAAARNSVP
jgi:hypothetical protein